MREQDRHGHQLEYRSSHVAENGFTQTRMSVAAHDHEIGAGVDGVRQERVADIDIATGNAMDVDLKPMASQMLANVGALYFILLAAFTGDDHYFDATAFANDRYRIGNGAGGCAAAVPADHHIIGFEWCPLNVRHHDHRPARLEERGFADDLFHAADFRLRLADNGNVETPRQAGELIAGTGETGACHQRFGGNVSLAGCGVETLDGGFGGDFVVVALSLDDLGRNVAGTRNRHDRVVNECDAGQMRFQSNCDRNGVFADDTALLGDAQIDNDVFDHDGGSLPQQC